MTQNTQRCRWCKELYRGKCGCDADAMLEKMAEALEEIRRCVYKNKYSNYTLTDDFDPQVITKAIQEYREMRDAK